MRSSAGTRTSHRPKRDERRAQEVVELKRENNHLRRANAMLRKEIERLDCLSPEDEPKAAAASKPTLQCPVCSSRNIFEMVTPGGKTIRSCRDCTWKT